MFEPLTRIITGPLFRTRSASRDHDTDSARVRAIVASIEAALRSARDEQDGLRRRIDEAVARAAITIGNDTAEYLDREPVFDATQAVLNSEISQGERRLSEIEESINLFNAARALIIAGCPNYTR